MRRFFLSAEFSFDASSPEDAIERIRGFLQQALNGEQKLPIDGTILLGSVAAEADLPEVNPKDMH